MQAPQLRNVNIDKEVVQAGRAWYLFLCLSSVKVREEVERHQLCMGVPEHSEQEKEQRYYYTYHTH